MLASSGPAAPHGPTVRATERGSSASAWSWPAGIRRPGRPGSSASGAPSQGSRDRADGSVRRGQCLTADAIVVPAQQQFGLVRPGRGGRHDHPDDGRGRAAAGAAGRNRRPRPAITHSVGCALPSWMPEPRVHVSMLAPTVPGRQGRGSSRRRAVGPAGQRRATGDVVPVDGPTVPAHAPCGCCPHQAMRESAGAWQPQADHGAAARAVTGGRRSAVGDGYRLDNG